jgi:hypothetical protein
MMKGEPVTHLLRLVVLSWIQIQQQFEAGCSLHPVAYCTNNSTVGEFQRGVEIESYFLTMRLQHGVRPACIFPEITPL